MVKISIIIPVYNAFRYLRECLESVLSQTLTDIEVICINDGSTDDSLQIMQEFQKKDARLKVISQKNLGVSAARNAGLALANGKYIGFVDSDDTVERVFFEMLFNAAEEQQADLVFSRGLEEMEVFTNRKYTRLEIVNEILPHYFKEDRYNAIWNKLYSAEVISKNKIIFPVGKTHGEDAEFNIHFLMHAHRMYMLAYSGYNYRETEGSATRNAAKLNYLQQAVETFHEEWNSVLGETITPHALHRLKKERFINNAISLIYIYSNPENGLPLKARIGRLLKIVHHELVKHIFNESNEEITASFSKYKKELYKAVKSRSVIKLYLLSLYSYFRSK